jgi:nucleotide-binding universal stress UspA family protein
MGAKGHSNLGLLLMGSVCTGVVQHATRPVQIARPDGGRVDRLLIGYEGSPAAKKAVTFLEKLDPPRAVKLHLNYIVEPFAVPSGTPLSYRKQAIEEAHKINERHKRTAERALTTLAKRLSESGREVTTEVETGVPGPELEKSAKQFGADLIVVGSRKPDPVRHYLLGSTAEKLVRHADKSVLVVR